MKTVVCPLTEEEINEIENGTHILKEYGTNPFQVLVIMENNYNQDDIIKLYDDVLETGDNLLICSISENDIEQLKIGDTVITGVFDNDDGEIEVSIMTEENYKLFKTEKEGF